MDANLRHLRILCDVAASGGANAAARLAHLSQPAISQAVSRMEHHFGARLFERSESGMVETAAGAICVARVRRALAMLRSGLLEVSRARRHIVPAEHGITASQLRALTRIVEAGSFASAARASGLASPTLHRSARELEARVKIPLFERTSFGIRPTREAAVLAQHARIAFGEIEQARAEVSETQRGLGTARPGATRVGTIRLGTVRAGMIPVGTTRIGAMPLARSAVLPETLVAFAARHPDHRVCILEGSYESLRAALANGQIDFLIGALRPPPLGDDLVQSSLFEDPLAIVMRARHPLARRRKVSIGTLAKYPWIVARDATPLRAQFDALFADSVSPFARSPARFAHSAARIPRHSIECNSLVAARGILMRSDHLMLSSRHQIRVELSAGLLHALPHPRGMTRTIGITTRRAWQPTRSQAELLELLRQHSVGESIGSPV